MDFGSALLLFGLDLDLLQGLVNHLYASNPAFQVHEPEDGGFRLELESPLIEVREDAGFRMGVHLTGRLFIGEQPDALVFDTWVRLRPEVSTDDDGIPAGALRFDEVEEVTPALAGQQVADAFGPDGFIGSVLETLTIPVFEDLLESANNQLFPNTDLDISRFAAAFYLGRPASMRRPLWDVQRVDDDWEPVLRFEAGEATKPALIASVALADDDPVPAGSPSIVRPATGLGLVTTAALFARRFAIESQLAVGQEFEGLTIDRLDIASTDYGFDIDGEGHKTGAEVDFAGALVGLYRGGVGGEFLMRSTVETDVDTAWWVDLLSVVAALVPGLGWILGDIFIWGPTAEAPGKVESALLEKFSTPLTSTAQKVAEGFGIENIPTSAYLADVWFFDGSMSVAAAAFAGAQTSTIRRVTRDVAYVARDPAGAGQHTNRRRPVTSVAEIIISSGQALKPWQAGQLVRDKLLTIPGHHAVSNPLATGGVYLRSDPDDTTDNNLLDD